MCKLFLSDLRIDTKVNLEIVDTYFDQLDHCRPGNEHSSVMYCLPSEPAMC